MNNALRRRYRHCLFRRSWRGPDRHPQTGFTQSRKVRKARKEKRRLLLRASLRLGVGVIEDIKPLRREFEALRAAGRSTV